MSFIFLYFLNSILFLICFNFYFVYIFSSVFLTYKLFTYSFHYHFVRFLSMQISEALFLYQFLCLLFSSFPLNSLFCPILMCLLFVLFFYYSLESFYFLMTDSKAMCSDGTRGGEELGEVEEKKNRVRIYMRANSIFNIRRKTLFQDYQSYKEKMIK